MEEYEPKRNVDKILVLATYITDTREQDTVTPEDVKREFRNAAEPVPGNYGRDWKWAVQNDWLAPADGLPAILRHEEGSRRPRGQVLRRREEEHERQQDEPAPAHDEVDL
jgi:hypothetical protein